MGWAQVLIPASFHQKNHGTSIFLLGGGGGGRGGEISGMGTSPYFSFVLNHGTSIFLLGRGEREEKQVRDNLIFMFRPILY